MSRVRTDLRPSITKLAVKGTLPSISHDRDKIFAESIKGQGLELSNSQFSANSSRRKQPEKKESLDHLLKEIEVLFVYTMTYFVIVLVSFVKYQSALLEKHAGDLLDKDV